MGEYYIGPYRDHYAIFDSLDRVQTQYDTHAEAKADLDSYNKTGKPLPESASINEGIFGLGKKKNTEELLVNVNEIKIISTNFRKAYDDWYFYIPLKDNINKEFLCQVANVIRNTCNSKCGFDAYPTEFMICSPKDIVREYKINSYFDKEFLKHRNNIILFSFEFVGKSNINSVASLKQYLGARYFNDVVNNAVYNEITRDPKNINTPVPELINNPKNFPVSYIDKDTLMTMYNYWVSRASANESVTFYDSSKRLMNEGTGGNIALGIFCLITMAPVIAAKVMEAKDKRRLKTGKGAHKISYEEFSTMYNSTKKLIQDVQRLQKSSKYYKIIYKYNTVEEEIVAGNKSSNILDAFKKGSPVELCGTCVYYEYDCIEEYKDLLKSLPEPDKEYYSDKNEDYVHDIEYAIQDEFNDHLDKLGFADGKDHKCRSSKYPGIYISYTESGDGTWFHIYPDCPGTIVVIDNNKLNEDHSEISNDPEIEELLNLAGCTIEDLDTINDEEDIELDDDDPIDVNTSREIDAIMDESFLGIKSKKEKNAKELTKDEFDKLINDMVSINDAIISKLKTSKWWKFIYEPCMNIDKEHFDANILSSGFKRDFSAGKLVSPSLHPKFIDIDNSDPRVYTKFDKESQKPYSNPKYEDLWEEGWTEGYYEAIKLVKDAVKKLGFNEDGKSSKYPDIEISISDSECVAIDISPIYTGYYKLKETDKKPQNESVVDDVRKDIDSYENEINITLTAARKYIKEAKTYTDKISAKRLTGSSGKIAADKANKEFNNKCDDIFSDEAAALQASYGSSLNKRSSFIRIYGYDSSKLNDQQKELYRKLDDKNNGKYFVEFKQIVNDLNKINDSLLAISAKHNNEPTYNISQVNAVIKQNNRMFNELSVFASDMDELQKLIGNSKTRMLFGKYIKDVVNESIEDLDYLMESIFMDIDH